MTARFVYVIEARLVIADNEEFELRFEVEEIAPRETSSSQTLGAGGLYRLPHQFQQAPGHGTRRTGKNNAPVTSAITARVTTTLAATIWQHSIQPMASLVMFSASAVQRKCSH